MSDFTVRIRFKIPIGDQLGIDTSDESYDWSEGSTLKLSSAKKGESINEARWLLLRSEGWETKHAAKSAAERLEDALRMALARFGMGADFGKRSPRSGATRAGLRLLTAWQGGRPVLNDNPGQMVFPSHPKPLFLNVSEVKVVRTTQNEQWEKAFSYALKTSHVLSEKERMAFDLLTVAKSVSRWQDAKFVLLFAALETLFEQLPRSDQTIMYVNYLVDLTRVANLPTDEKNSLIGSLNWLRSHSIRQTGRFLMRDKLGQRSYEEKPAEQVFLDSYEIRNRLLHGQPPYPSKDELGKYTGPLELIVGHLIAGPVLNVDV